jgi:isopenicillin N synthase-like dioxygenase
VHVPLVDLSAPSAVEDVGRACEEIGFLTLVGHDVPVSVVDEVRSLGRVFFDLDDAEKRRLETRDPLVPGLPVYRPLASESLAAARERDAPRDLKESLDWGPAVPGVAWPERPAGLRAAVETLHVELSQLAGRLRRLLALALGLEEEWFEPFFERHASSMRLINYPQQQSSVAPGQLRAGAHTDYGFLTFLRTEPAAGGLEVQTREGTWVGVPWVADSIVVNLGDMAARWTNDRWPATLHRVANPPPGVPQTRRQTIVFFHDPDPQAVIQPLAASGQPARYEPITALDHIRARAERALAGSKSRA